ncbi:uncharacterized protein LOC127285731 [Leptopilina boulardi]|uniref:uncharacterized protein LOC127285731 n=1 Tax=Leptopilina boulardi TaxID=63433 RepID=UPI0021F68C39|nr:uncharacterized protein LOC127285731 [Leptopilina boulardi]
MSNYDSIEVEEIQRPDPLTEAPLLSLNFVMCPHHHCQCASSYNCCSRSLTTSNCQIFYPPLPSSYSYSSSSVPAPTIVINSPIIVVNSPPPSYSAPYHYENRRRPWYVQEQIRRNRQRRENRRRQALIRDISREVEEMLDSFFERENVRWRGRW